MNGDILISIIIPHKNRPNLLRRCLDSIPRRKDIQIIIIDDNSGKDVVDFEKFPGLDERFVDIHFVKENIGAGDARNIGISLSKGKWILFADSDDYFEKNAFSFLLEQTQSVTDIIYFKVVSRYSNTFEHSIRDKQINSLIDNFLDKKDDSENQLRYRFMYPWAKMIRRNFILKYNIVFDNVIASNDVLFSLYSGHYASLISASNHVIYCYMVNEGSLANTFNKETLTAHYLTTLRRNRFLINNDRSRYQSSGIMYLLLSSIKYGLPLFIMFLKLLKEYNINPFVGITRWKDKIVYLFLDRKDKEKQIKKRKA